MHASFSVGLLAGILLASAVVFGTIYASAQTQPAAGTLSSVAGQAKTTTVDSTSSSTTAQGPTVAFTNGIVSTTTNSSVGAGVYGGGGSNASSPNSAASFLPSSRLGALSSQPGRVPILLLPLIAALLFGFALYKVSVRKD